MGLDFRIDETPRALVNGEETPVDEVRGMFEDLEYEFTEHTTITVEVIPAPELKVPDDYEGRARWSYGGFMRFREKIAEGLGLNLRLMWGFKEDNPYVIIGIKDGTLYKPRSGPFPVLSHAEEEALKQWWVDNSVDWNTLEPNPLHDLLHHSDCDGDLSAKQCAAIAPVLREAVSKWPEDDYDREAGEQLAGMMEVCAANGRKLIFC